VSKVALIKRINRELEFQPLYGLQEGWRQTVAAWRASEAKLDIAEQ